MNPLREVAGQGQSIWLDAISRELIASGRLKRLIEEDGLRGVTSNPTIFDQAISRSGDYDAALRALLRDGFRRDAQVLYETLAVEDIRAAADLFRPVFHASEGGDGFVSIEVSPHLARDADASIAEAHRLWRAVDRPNAMIKIPATQAGVRAIEALIADGINVNATLMFSLRHYEDVARAYLRGLERNAKPQRVASVASFFVSRVDAAVDPLLERRGTAEAMALRGRIAIANAKLAYLRFREIFHGDAFAALRLRGARVQRPLWGSTGTKNRAYSDVLYVEELIGPETVNTVPLATLDAFRDHGRVRPSLLEATEQAREDIARLAALGIDLTAITGKLQEDGVAAFAASFDNLLAALRTKCEKLRAGSEV